MTKASSPTPKAPGCNSIRGTQEHSIRSRCNCYPSASASGSVDADRHSVDSDPSAPEGDRPISSGVFHDPTWASGDDWRPAFPGLAHLDLGRIGSKNNLSGESIGKQLSGALQRCRPSGGDVASFSLGCRFSSMDGTIGIH